MQITITGRHLGVTEAMKAYARTKVEKLLRFAGRTTQASVTMDVQHQDHEVEIVLDVPRGARLVGKASAPDMYAAVDLAEHKLAMQLRKAHDRRHDHHRGERARGAVPAPGPAPGAPGRAQPDEGLSTYEDVIERLRRGE